MNIIKKINFFSLDSNNKIKIISVLCIIVLVFLVLNYFVADLTKKQHGSQAQSLKDEILSIDSAIDNIFNDYGIKKEWKTKQSVQLRDDILRFEREIRIPYNFPIVDMNREISSLCSRYNSSTSSNEDIKNQIVQLHIYHRGLVIQNIRFITDPSLLRIDGNIVVLMKGLTELNDVAKSFVLKSPLFKNYLLDYRNDNSEIVRIINKQSKDYLLELNIKEKMEDEEYDISLDMDSMTVRKKMKNIFRNLENPRGFYVSYDKYDDKFNQLLKKEILNFNKIMIMKSEVITLKEENGNLANFSEVSKQSAVSSHALCSMSLSNENINNLIEAMRGMQRKGFRFEKISEISKK